MSSPHLLVVAKAPVPGRVKTRLGADVGMTTAAELAAASLLDTIAACEDAVGPDHCHLSLEGDLAGAVHGDRLSRDLDAWAVRPQVGDGLGERLAHALAGVPGPVVQIGMDTPQVTPELLLAAADGLDDDDAVLGPAEDGGWWVLALLDPAHASVLRVVPMSTPTTYDDTRSALVGAGLTVGSTTILRDVDTVDDAVAVAGAAPGSQFARTWARVSTGALKVPAGNGGRG